MEDTSENKKENMQKKASGYVSIGLLAHVDAGKTTLSESILVAAGALARAGRVDKGDAFLDTDPMEKERGITIFSKQAIITLGDREITLLDTPGHVDFAAEAERTLQALDGAVLVISASDGVQSHTRTLWRLLRAYGIPTVVFVNKMDMPGVDRERVMRELQATLDDGCVDIEPYFHDEGSAALESVMENIAMCDEAAMEAYLEQGTISPRTVSGLFFAGKLFPVWFGSALCQEGVDALLKGIAALWEIADSDTESAGFEGGSAGASAKDFAGRVYKIGRDEKGERLTFMKVTAGSLHIKDVLGGEKVNAIRRYHGSRYETVTEASRGMVCAVTGLKNTRIGQGLGTLEGCNDPLLAPVLSCRLILPEDVDAAAAIPRLSRLAEEEPDLQLEYEEESKEISLKLMGQVQTEILQRKIRERFGYEVSFGESRIVYRETIAGNAVEGVGHFEPLRHYAEVHLLLEPGERGSGLVFAADCSEDVLDRNWQRLALTHLRERQHRGVLTGSAVTDMKITLVSGRAHPKHTEGGDFRQATYRALRQGLMQAQSVLLEPYYDFVLKVPQAMTGRAMTDLEHMHALDFSPEIAGETALLRGRAPVACMQGYAMEVTAYTKGLGHLSLALGGYDVCHNAKEVIADRSYDPTADIRNTPDSVFCEHGSGVIVSWDQVCARMHMPSVLIPSKELTDRQIRMCAKTKAASVSDVISTEEVDAILGATAANRGKEFHPHKGIGHKRRRTAQQPEARGGGEGISPVHSGTRNQKSAPAKKETAILLVDGYNIIFAWEELAALAAGNLDAARGVLLDRLCNHQAISGYEIIAVFDAYRLQNHPEEFLDYHNIHVVFTKTAETADRYIERFANLHGRRYRITVATSDGMEQIIVQGEGCRILSAKELKTEMAYAAERFNEEHGVGQI